MTDPDSIEAALRQPAPDEPAVMPPLAIDEVATTLVRSVAVERRIGDSGSKRRAGVWPLALVGAIVVAVVAWQLAGSAGPRPSSSATPASLPSNPSGPSAAPEQLTTLNAPGLSFEYPSNWGSEGTEFPLGTFGSPIAILGTFDLSTCGSNPVDRSWKCAPQLKPGEVFVYVGTVAAMNGSFLDLAPPGGFTDRVDGMPAVAKSTGPDSLTGADEVRAWQIGMPGSINMWYTVGGSFRGPGVGRLRDQFDNLVRSIRFDQPTPSLPTDAASIDAVVARAVDAVDRKARVGYHSSYYACFPRHVGASAPTIIADGPGGPLVGPIRVICTVSMQAEPVGLFVMTLAASWDAGRGYAAGTVKEVMEVTPKGEVISTRGFGDSSFPATKPGVTP